MPHTTPTEDDPLADEDSAPDPVDYAEQALLGALLSRPALIHQLPSLSPGDFARHAHGALFAAITQLAPPPATNARGVKGAPALPSLEWIRSVFTAASARSRGLHLPYLHHLIHTCPTPEHAPAYARIVQAGHARRSLGAHAERLAQLTHDTTRLVPAAAVADQVQRLLQHLDTLQQQHGFHTSTPPRTPSAPLPGNEPTADELSAEQSLLAGLLHHPESIAGLPLRPADFTDPLHSGLFACLTAMAHRGHPIDPVTVLTEAQQRGLLTRPDTAQSVMALVQPNPDDPAYWTEQILHHTVLRTARTAAHRIRAYTVDPATTAHQLLIGTRRALAEVTGAHRRWQLQRTPPAPPPSRPPVTVRAPTARTAPPPVTRTAR
ncbi:DnaB-like helicase N-terminal domain-containing protein [Streptomyces sp. NPDC088745]|uniref:DnaB-like helicase N-terminal domain-containing protein n=1 Tax=Streptomyces sp. NPDC088745 TaxID=3365884 RepID=UPI0037F34FC8